ncbi:hypothetical protein DSM3645_16000 [Blastopirellula marina DSM 3645]|uniref:Uncharacterized protein n=2 Tax=Blastopirellula marina TaxID=124 RepID=A3ZZP6_9BACT|nr:hypothetical protein DSM3645_02056 [Blastopirellula marina DSM 3645]EAQ77966.1 hypothetical protein DSM3645_16000 [Blastopirellula marina DSM 3645]
MGVNAFSIFAGLGCGSLIFGLLAPHGTGPAMLIFAAAQLGVTVVASFLFRGE